MHLYGLLDSPFVRRVAISMKLLGIPYEHTKWSVFRNAEELSAINPMLKAPTIVVGDTVLMESAIILDYLEGITGTEATLMPTDHALLLRSQRYIGVALIACEKIIQLMLETQMRPPETQSEMFAGRFRAQMVAAFDTLETDLPGTSEWLLEDRPMQADITVAVTWMFGQIVFADFLRKEAYPKLAALSEKAEGLPAFLDTSPFDA